MIWVTCRIVDLEIKRRKKKGKKWGVKQWTTKGKPKISFTSNLSVQIVSFCGKVTFVYFCSQFDLPIFVVKLILCVCSQFNLCIFCCKVNLCIFAVKLIVCVSLWSS